MEKLDAQESLEQMLTGFEPEDVDPEIKQHKEKLLANARLVVLQDAHAPDLYKTDYYRWVQLQSALLLLGKVDALDRETLADEVSDLGKMVVWDIKAELEQLLGHLLIWCNGMTPLDSSGQRIRAGIELSRLHLMEDLKESPSLYVRMGELIDRAYTMGIANAIETTGVEDGYPEACPWTLEQILDPEFFPNPCPSPE